MAVVTTQANAAPLMVIETSDPITLFREVCLGDQVRLSAEAYEHTNYAEISKGAREALGFSLPAGLPAVPGTKNLSLPESEVPNQFYKVRSAKGTYLMLPARSEQTGRAAPQCGVLWKGRQYSEALKAARAIRPIPAIDAEPPRPALPGFGYTVIRSKGAIIGVAEWGDWTVLRIGADTSPEEQSTQ